MLVTFPARGAAYVQQDTPVVLRFSAGRVLAPRLPYHAPFGIAGSALSPQGTPYAAVAVQVYRANRRHEPVGEPVDQSCWLRPATGDVNNFRVYLDPLELGRRYALEFQFYRDFPSAELEPADRKSIVRLTREYQRTDQLDSARAAAIVREALAEEVRRLMDDGSVLYLDPEIEGRCTSTTATPPVPVSRGQVDQLRDAAVLAAEAEEQMELRQEGIDSLSAVDAAAFNHLVTSLRQALKPGRKYTEADVQSLVQARRNLQALPQAAVDALNAEIQDGTSPLSDADAAVLERVLGASIRIASAGAEAEQRAGEAEQAAKPILTAVRGLFARGARAHVVSVPWGSDTEVRAVQVGTAYGGGFAYLDVADNAADDGFSFVSLKLYLGPVDKRLPTPWASRRARFALNLGAVAGSTIRYRGQTQQDAFAGLKPMLGVSWDAQRRIGIHAGMLVFRQPSVNPLATGSRQRLRTAPFFGVAFDFDALNELGTMIAGRKP